MAMLLSDNLKAEVKNLSFYYNHVQALKSINLPIAEKKITALIGPSGCGKTTYLRCFNRMHDLYPGNRYEGEILLHPGFFEWSQPVDPLSTPLDELLYGALLARGRGAEIHGCGLIDAHGNGLLFAGRSGAGKTTMARLWQDVPGTTILSDDRIILRKLAV